MTKVITIAKIKEIQKEVEKLNSEYGCAKVKAVFRICREFRAEPKAIQSAWNEKYEQLLQEFYVAIELGKVAKENRLAEFAEAAKRADAHYATKDIKIEVVNKPAEAVICEKSEGYTPCKSACVGDEITFEQAIFSGSYRNAKFVKNIEISGKVVKESYGADKQQHTFTIEVLSCSDNSIEVGSKICRKGRNIYKNCMRKLWENETNREVVLEEKYARGDAARTARTARRGY